MEEFQAKFKPAYLPSPSSSEDTMTISDDGFLNVENASKGTKRFLKRSDGSIKQSEGSIDKAEGSIDKAEGSILDKAEGSNSKKQTKYHSQSLVFELNEDAQCRWINDHVESIFGDIRGKHIEEIFSDQPKVIEEYQKISSGHEFIYFEIPEQYSWVIQGLRTSDGQLTGTVITAQAVLPSEADEIILMPTTWSYDLLQNELQINDVLAKVFGFDHSKLHFRHARNQLPEVMSLLKEGSRRLFLKEADFFLKEVRIKDTNGNTRWLSVRGQVANQNKKGHVTRLNGSIEDITKRVTDIRNRQELEKKVLNVQKMEAIGELAGGIAHDFNNILTTVMGYTELAMIELMPDSDPKMSTYLQEIYQGGRRARDLVDKILTFSRTEAIEAENCSLMLEVKDIVKMLRSSLPSSIEIRIDIDEGLPEVFIDKSFLQQMLMNVCINSRDAMPDGGTIYIRGRSRSVRGEQCDSCHSEFVGTYVELSIEDTGNGISDSILSRIFEPYVSTKEEGSGLGLSMVHGIMHRQGGHVKVDSLYEDGTEFRFFLKPAEHTGVKMPLEPYIDISKDKQNTQKHILVIDDEVSLVYFLKELLQKKGYVVSVASDSHEAWDIFSSNPDKFDLVVTDQTMPGLSGVQLAAKMLTLKKDLPIVLCTGYSDIVDEYNIRQYGIKGYMAKPIDSKELLRSVKALLQEAD